MASLFSNISTYAQLSGDKIQEWINRSYNVKIQFTYAPQRPLIGAVTVLKFSIQDLRSGEHLKNLIATGITVTDGQRVFKFNNIPIPAGNFSIKMRFMNEGTYQVITRIDSKNDNDDNIAIALATFKVFVPFQAFGTINTTHLTPLLLPAIIVIGIIGIVIITILVILSKREKLVDDDYS
jgi:hypothetical protein